jgi:hypothetical protein
MSINIEYLYTHPLLYILLVFYTVVLVHKRTIPTERPPLVDELTAKFRE